MLHATLSGEIAGTMPSALATEQALALGSPLKVSARERWIELGLVMFVAFAPLVLISTYAMWFGLGVRQEAPNLRYLYIAMEELGALGVLWYVLRRSGRTFAGLGLSASLKGVLIGAGLAFCAMAAGLVVRVAIELIHRAIFGSFITPPNMALMFPKARVAIFVVFLLVNCFFEEAIVRAYLMSELSQLTGSMIFAAIASVLIQLSYHTYQGWFNVASLGAAFTVFSVYYARRKKLFPLYMAHLAMDALAGVVLYTRY